MAFSRYGQHVLVLHERRSRLLLVNRLPNKTAVAVLKQLHRRLSRFPKPMRRSLTFDNVLCGEAAAALGQQISARRFAGSALQTD
jgi:IS30 family transposase